MAEMQKPYTRNGWGRDISHARNPFCSRRDEVALSSASCACVSSYSFRSSVHKTLWEKDLLEGVWRVRSSQLKQRAVRECKWHLRKLPESVKAMLWPFLPFIFFCLSKTKVDNTDISKVKKKKKKGKHFKTWLLSSSSFPALNLTLKK